MLIWLQRCQYFAAPGWLYCPVILQELCGGLFLGCLGIVLGMSGAGQEAFINPPSPPPGGGGGVGGRVGRDMTG